MTFVLAAGCTTTQSPRQQVQDSRITAQVKAKIAADVNLSTLGHGDRPQVSARFFPLDPTVRVVLFSAHCREDTWVNFTPRHGEYRAQLRARSSLGKRG